jgi:ABC-type multidrug transport system ATPase subunit
MRQRASLARVLQTDPELLLLDEPFSNLDVQSASHLVELLTDFRTWPVAGGGARTIILTTHQAALAEPLADRVLTMRQGQIIDTTGTNG